jgi:hypothetical protein
MNRVNFKPGLPDSVKMNLDRLNRAHSHRVTVNRKYEPCNSKPCLSDSVQMNLGRLNRANFNLDRLNRANFNQKNRSAIATTAQI